MSFLLNLLGGGLYTLITFTPSSSTVVHSSDEFVKQTLVRFHLAASLKNAVVPWMFRYGLLVGMRRS